MINPPESRVVHERRCGKTEPLAHCFLRDTQTLLLQLLDHLSHLREEFTLALLCQGVTLKEILRI